MLDIKFDSFPILSTPRLNLRAIDHSDSIALFELRSNDQVLKYLDREPPSDIQEIETLIQKIVDSFAENEGINWAITLKGNNQLIGTIGFWRIIKEHHRAEIGYLLHPNYWNNGLMFEALMKVISYGFNNIKFHSIEANVNPNNLASIKLLKKTGFRQEAYFKENYYYNGKFFDSAIFTLLSTKTNNI
ncbi:GNAT family N-acetyltransferase [Solitalea lacus]|uniref:GNAT family N-acetyltransferase n=1 Tax=Solitalea lacus TaxID=2911172 RepID=UPI001EDC3A14|nr:GNAT family N-acetyltransferase [Solitalea lacus]UKJ05786.1 GNAT family N-acetyltransferase [Solitalea lacus]